MGATRGQFAQLLAPGIFAVIYDDLAQHPEVYTQIFTVLPSTKAYEEDQIIAGLGGVPKKFEGEGIAYDQPIQGGSIRYQHDSFGLGFQVTKEMWDDDQYGVMKRVSTDFGRGIRQTLESTYANVLNNGFTTVVTADGASLFNKTHNLLGGSSYSNEAATDIALSVTGIQEALLSYDKMVNERGLLVMIEPKTVWIHPDNQFVASEILHSAYDPYTGNNTVNTVQGRLEPRMNRYFSSSPAWFVLADKTDHTLKGYWRTQPEFDSKDDFDTKGAAFSTFFRFSAGVTDWRGTWGSKGA
jgi:hypothetical protein